MKHNYISFPILTRIIIFAFLLPLSGCGEEKESSATATTTELASSTRLSENTLPTGMDFSNFKDATVSIDPSALSLIGNRIFLKLSRDNNELLYLGEIDRYQVLSISVQVPLSDTKLFYEIFTDNTIDQTIFGIFIL